jgi:tubulin alpha
MSCRRYCIEHGLDFSGRPDASSAVDIEKTSATPFFNETSSGKHVPRSLFVDLDPSTIDEIRTGPYRQLFHPGLLINGKEDASNVNCLPIEYAPDAHHRRTMQEVIIRWARS